MKLTARLVKFFNAYLYVGLALFFPLLSEAAPREFVYQGRILRPDGSPLEGNIDFLIKIYSPAPSKCLLWAERQNLNMHGSMGAFSLDIGKAAHRLNGAEGGGGISFSQIFINHPGLTINSSQCNTGYNSYTPGSTDERTISVSFSDAGREIRVVDLPVKSVPFAMQAEQISGYSVNSLFKIAGTAQPGDKPSSLFAKDGVDLLWEIAHNQDWQGLRLKNLGEPTIASDAATKNYVDSLISQGSMGVITNVTGDANILAGTIGTVRSLSLGTTGVTADVYGAVAPTGVSVPVLTVDMWGRITSASQEPMPLATTGGGFGLITVDASSGLTLNSGTLGLNLNGLSGANFDHQAQNLVLAGPVSGGTGVVSFRQLDEADIPQLAATGKVQNSATSATPALTNDAIIARDAVGGFKASGAFLNYLALDNGLHAGTSSAILLSAPMGSDSYSLIFPGAAPQDGDLLSFHSSGQMSWVRPGAAGLTSLALSVPTAEMNVSSPVGPGDGTLSLSWKNQNAGLVFAAPTGVSGQPSFRQLAASDLATGTFGAAQIPDLDAAKITSGTLPVSRGGTGLVPQVSDANRLYGINAAGTDSEFKTLVAGTGVAISNTAGSIQISAPGAGTLGWAQGGNSFAQTGTLGTNDNQALALKTNGSIRVAITAGGSVGIGTTSPAAQLHIADGPVRIGRSGASNAGKLDFIGTNGALWASAFADNAIMNLWGHGGVRMDSNSANDVAVSTPNNKAAHWLVYNDRPFHFVGASNGGEVIMRNEIDGETVFHAHLSGAKKTVFPTGNVGIGTAAPALKLDVAGSTVFRGPTIGGVDGELYYDTATHSYRYYNAGTSSWESLASGSVTYNGSTWGQNGSDTYYDAGRVGIGTTNPQAKLHVVSGNNTFRFNNGAASITPNITVGTSGGKSLGLLVGTAGATFTFDGSGYFSISKDSKANIDGGTSAGGTSLLHVNANGNVGIGMTPTTEKLEVSGNVKIGSATTGSVLANKELVMRQDGDLFGSTVLRLRNRTGENGAILEATSAYDLVDLILKTGTLQRNIRLENRAQAVAGAPSFQIGGASADAPTLAVGDTKSVFSGKVGIGTASPASALHVAGKITVSGDTPVLSACGSGSPSVDGNDTRGQVTMGSGDPTSCTLTFASAYGSTPVCVVSPLSAGATFRISAVSTTAFTVTLSAGASGFQFSYICLQ